MEEMNIHTAFTLLEPGPVILVTTNDGHKNNIMTISWTMVMDFTPQFRPYHRSMEPFLRCFEANQRVRSIHPHS